AADHDAFYDVVHRAARRGRSLFLEDLEVVSVVRLTLGELTAHDRVSDMLADRTAPGSVGVLPREAVLFTARRNHALCVLVDVVDRASPESVFVVRFHKSSAHGDGIELIATNTPVEKLDAPRCGVERPFAVALHNRHRGRPVLLANQKNGVRGVLRIYVYALL